jgi:hypothetical protein
MATNGKIDLEVWLLRERRLEHTARQHGASAGLEQNRSTCI